MNLKEMAKEVNNSAYSFIRDRLTPSLLVLIFGAIVTVWVTLKTVTFSSVEMKVKTEEVVGNVKNLQRLDSLSGHMLDQEIHKPYAVMNELWVPRYEIDSMNLENIKYMNQLTTQIDATNRMVIRTNVMVQEFIKSNK